MFKEGDRQKERESKKRQREMQIPKGEINGYMGLSGSARVHAGLNSRKGLREWEYL